jgi:23S rRNA (adenine2503-C2)-methyltransferase
MASAGDDPRDLRDLTLPELTAVCSEELGLPPFRARQIFSWIHARGVSSTEPMTNLSKDLRASVAGLGSLAPLELDAELRAADGTRKLRLRCRDGAAIETVLIPEEGKLTQCVSSQVGCGLACSFCATGAMGLRRSLSPGEIADQVYRARALAPDDHISNLVFMGMGEPLNNLPAVLAAVENLCNDLGQNFSPRRITISTAGVVPGIDELGRLAPQLGLAISLNATTDEVRSRLMPVNKRWPLDALFAALHRYPLPRRRRITFEYVLIAGVNDTVADARRLPRLLDGIRCKINLIAYNPATPGVALAAPTDEEVEAFAERLRDKDLPTYVRRSRGQEIAAACGQLAMREPL